MNRIKIIFSIILAMTLMVNTTSSQDISNNNGHIVYGIKGGINQSTQAGFNDENISSRPGYQFGLFISNSFLDEWLPELKNLHLRVELNYIKSEARINDNGMNRILFWGARLFTDEDLHGYHFARNVGGPYIADEIFEENIYSTFTSHLIEAPFLLNYSIPTGFMTPYLFFGPAFSLLVDLDYSFTFISDDGQTYTQTNIDQTVNQQINKFNIGLNTGLGLRLPLGLFIEAHYTFGLTDTMLFYDQRINYRGIVANIGIQL